MASPKETRAVEKNSFEVSAEGHNNEVEVRLYPHNRPDNIHPGTWKLFHYFPFLESVPILGLVLKAYSPHLVIAVFVERLFVKGLSHGFMRLSVQPMLTGRYELSGPMYQKLSSLYGLGWSVNSFFTAIADTFALFGYTKRWYSVFCALGGCAFALVYSLMPAKESSAQPAAAFMFLTALFLANVDTFAQAIYSRRIRHSPESGPALVSWAWGVAKIGAMIAAAVQGPLSDNNLTQVGVYIVAGLLFVLSFLFVFNVFDEKPNQVARVQDAKADFLLKRREKRNRLALEAALNAEPTCDPDKDMAVAKSATQTSEEDEMEGFVQPEVNSYWHGAIEMNKEVVTRNWPIMIYCVVVTAAVVAVAVVTILGTRWDLLYACIAMTVVMCAGSFFALPLVIAKAGTFIYFFNIFYVSLPGVLNTFYMAKPGCLPDGPHFNYTFYNIMNGIVGNFGAIIGITMFAHLFQNYSYRAIMGASAIIIPIISIFDLIIVKRWNMYIGIPDHAMYILGDAVIFETIDMLVRMPTFLLMSRVAPRGSEAMVLALMGGTAHIGMSTSSAIGYLLLETIWPVTTKNHCDYHNAPWLIIAGHFGAPLLILPVAFFLLPSARVSATLDENGDEMVEVVLSHKRAGSSCDGSGSSSSSSSSSSWRNSPREGRESRISAGDPLHELQQRSERAH